jgi:hypothetical protein
MENVVAFVTEMVNKKVRADGRARVKCLRRNAEVASNWDTIKEDKFADQVAKREVKHAMA